MFFLGLPQPPAPQLRTRPTDRAGDVNDDQAPDEVLDTTDPATERPTEQHPPEETPS